MSAFTKAGRDLIAQKQGAREVLTLDRFVLANIEGLDYTQPVNPDEVLPDAGDIVWQGAVSAQGYVDPEQVVYSLLLGTNVGDFSFNWVGLLADDDTLVAVSYVPPQQKSATSGTATGNNLTRNFLLAFTDAQATTNITVQAETWQIDFNARVDGIDERERMANLAIYGRQRFMNDGFKVLEEAGSYSISAGEGFVAGLHVSLEQALTLDDPGVLPKDIWLDVSLAGDLTGKTIRIVPAFFTAAQSDYVDGVGTPHFLVKIAKIETNGTATDLRQAVDVTTALIDEFLRQPPAEFEPGDIIMHYGDISKIRPGWALCDGTNGTPDLTDRFVVGAGKAYEVGAVGGSADAVVVSHSHGASASTGGYHGHSASTSSAGSHRHLSGKAEANDFASAYGGVSGSSRHRREGLTGSNASTYHYTSTAGGHSHSVSVSGNGSHSHSISVQSAGEDGKGKNLPPYYALAFIMKL
ncbi:hypothetical protein RE428_07990 [Marinobacter nanhaiticus D15-8W]|uniref:Phage tail fibre protein N-terminal domain-containing protein n=1 Tax=Marinobacter nanhaiticus D15-8W TaxID=626887 RepID=N6W3A1_9GAMM|nr:phage tail protein [Marinobacter nanhaiticus]ENO14579.1 hypothetical protein J057_04491 [Marinobacter nanhaiticus D15-8W]BES69736.1 hypothetical protein RE428_07540 [Marinobacter nanhaiticus D15-8W]BES69781.1 hypothetical protein RE428_07990 [Marinobacter nanhaiticus D15-8W]